MKKIISCLILCIILFTGCKKNEKEGTINGNISISGAWALYPMAVKWAEEFQKLYPGVKIDLSAGGAGKGMSDALADIIDIGLVSREIYKEEIAKGAWYVAVTKDAVIATISKNNPCLNKILEKGLTKEEFAKIWITGEIKYWDELIGQSNQNLINVYTRSDACGAADTWAAYMGKKQEDLLGVGVYSDPGLVESVKKDNLGIGYNNINYLYDANTKKPVDGVLAIPVDTDNNKKIDKNENFYNNRDEILDAIKKDKYPSPPARLLYFVTHDKPNKVVTVEFIKWVLTEGQNYSADAGYIRLSENLLKEQLKKLK